MIVANRTLGSLLFLLLALQVGRVQSAEWFVASDGSDSNPGTQAQPLATLQAARDRIRDWKRTTAPGEQAVTVWIRGGVYELTAPLELTGDDSGTSAAPVTYAAFGNEDVQILGGRLVTRSAPAGDSPLTTRLTDEARRSVRMADLRSLGMDDFGRLEARGYDRQMFPAGLEVFLGGRPLPLAGWPNDGWARVTELRTEETLVTFSARGPRPWQTTQDVWLHGFWANDWADSYDRAWAADPNSGSVTLEKSADLATIRGDARFRVLNVVEELDQPGEWYLDRPSGQLYFWPPQSGTLVASWLETPISCYGTSHLTFRGLTIEATRVMGIEIAGGENVGVENCTIRNIGNVGVHIFHGRGHRVMGCEIAHTGDDGILVEGGDRAMLEPGQHLLENNDIHHFGRTCMARPAVNVRGVGVRVAHNRIHDGPHSAILLSGNEHVVEHNEVFAVCQETADAGAVYVGPDPTFRGNVIRHNYLHDLGGFTKVDVMAVYLDDFVSGTTVFGNVVHQAGRGVAVGGGRDNVIENNVFVDCLAGVQVDCRGRTWARAWVTGKESYVANCCQEVGHTEAPFKDRYPQLATLLDDEPEVAKGNQILRNIVCCQRDIELYDGLTSAEVAVQDNLVDTDPLFVDREQGDLRLRPDSPAFTLGFQPIPWDRIGRSAAHERHVAGATAD